MGEGGSADSSEALVNCISLFSGVQVYVWPMHMIWILRVDLRIEMRIKVGYVPRQKLPIFDIAKSRSDRSVLY